MRVLIIGLGSIAKKHIAALRELVPNVEILALRSCQNSSSVDGVDNIYTIEDVGDYDFSIISNPSYLHGQAIASVLKFGKPIFLEKPPFTVLSNQELKLIEEIKHTQCKIYSAFNLRFLDVLQYLKNNLVIAKVQEVNVYCGSNLSNWRPGQNYKESYSSSTELGGGVHVDLIHELDYVTWIFGKPNKVHSVKKSKSYLNIESVDYANYLMEYDNFCVNITLNYFRSDAKRSCEILFPDETLMVDLLNNQIEDKSKGALIFKSENKIIDTYKKQMEYFLNLIKNDDKTDSFFESIEVLKLALQ